MVATFFQSAYLGVRPGDYAEVIFAMYPGRVFPAKVVNTVDISEGGQMASAAAHDPNIRLPAAHAARARGPGKIDYIAK